MLKLRLSALSRCRDERRMMIGMALALVVFAVAGLWQERTLVSSALLDASVRADSPQVACVTVATEARFAGLAYNHIVHIANGCSVPMTCTVATDVSTEVQTVTVPPESRAAVVTFIGSPASAFTADVRCAR
jgi:hypothetical protein